MIGSALGLYLASLAHGADPLVAGGIVTITSAVFTVGTHLIFAKLGVPDPFA